MQAAESAAPSADDGFAAAPTIPAQSLGAIFVRFLRFGALAWGGPVAQIAMIKKELVEEERWISVERFNRVLAVYQVLPGPEAHELCVYFGMLARGRAGAVLAGLGFMLPGFLLMLLLSWAYVTVGLRMTGAAAAFAGIQAAVVALVVRAVHRIGRHAVTSPVLWAVAGISFLASLLDVHFAVVFGFAAVLYPLVRRRRWALATTAGLAFVAISAWNVAAVADRRTQADAPQARSQPSLAEVSGAGARTGLLTFGGAYTAVPLLQHDAVVAGGWMSNEEFLDGIALGGVLPAPLIIFGTFVGFVAAGWAGALLMTLCIFLPAFLFTLVGHGVFERLTQNRGIRDALDGVTAAVVGLIAATLVALGRSALESVLAWAIFLLALGILYAWRSRAAIPVTILVAGGIGLFASAL